MSQTSLHTIYRPKTFDEVVGQKDAIESLKLVVKNKRAKTFLFVGPSGCGKTTLARILANEFAGGESTQANVVEVDAATYTGVDSVRTLAAQANYKAIGSSHVKAIICDEAHKFSNSAWSALLKPIEEPPSHVYWMFCTTEFGKIPKTILTRCLKIELKLVSEENLLKLLKRVNKAENLEVNSDILEAIAENSSNSPRQALVNLEACLYAESTTEALRLMKAASESKEVIDLCRYLIRGKAFTWLEAMKHVKPLLEAMDPESVRIVIANYFAKALLSTRKDEEAIRLLSILECFSTPYTQTDKEAPLMLSIGEAIGLGED